ncbi:glycosyltransferase [Candidatus Woesearchaeota archaeon]|nr:glycosyltransferase [Candidatus Woesearchaeota archaeon]
MKKILVGCPTSDYHEYALKEYAEAVKSLSYKNYDIMLVDNSKEDSYFKKLNSLNLPTVKGPYFESARERIITSRNILRQKVLDGNYDYFLSLEQDVIPPKDVIERLLQHKKRVVTGVYFNYINTKKGVELAPVVWSKVNLEKEERYFLKPSELNRGLIKIAMSGVGCILMHRSVLEKIKFRYEKQYPAFDDIFFGLDCRDNKIEIYADTNMICRHLIKNRPWSWSNLK